MHKGRSSTRLHAPPGGKVTYHNRSHHAESHTRAQTSDIFGSGPAPAQKGGVKRGPQERAAAGSNPLVYCVFGVDGCCRSPRRRPGCSGRRTPTAELNARSRTSRWRILYGSATTATAATEAQRGQRRESLRVALRSYCSVKQSAGAQKNRSTMQLGGEPAAGQRQGARASSRTAKMNESSLSFGDDGGSSRSKGGGVGTQQRDAGLACC